MIGDNLPVHLNAPNDAAVGIGASARYMMMVPSLGVTVVSIGASDGWTQQCSRGYDDAWPLTLLWASMAPALAGVTAARPPAPGAAAGATPRPARHAASASVSVSRAGGSAPPPAAALAAAPGKSGACNCKCSNDRGNGRCFAVAPGVPAPKRAAYCVGAVVGNESTAAPLGLRNAEFCPASGVVKQCRYPEDAHRDLCAGQCGSDFAGPQWTCTQLRACAPAAGTQGAYGG